MIQGLIEIEAAEFLYLLVQSVVVSHGTEPLENSTVYPLEYENKKVNNCTSIILKTVLASVTSWKILGSPGVPEPYFGTCGHGG